MLEFPSSNLDDSGPKTAVELGESLRAKQKAGEKVYLVVYRGRPVGAIGYAQTSPDEGRFRGICFTREVHGSGVPFQAVRMVLDQAFNSGTRIVGAVVFADNVRVQKFLKKLGGEDLWKPWRGPECPATVRDGEPLQQKIYGIHIHDFLRAMQGRAFDQEHPHQTGDLRKSA